MSRKTFLIVGSVLTVLALIGLTIAQSGILWGMIVGEPFYGGRSLSAYRTSLAGQDPAAEKAAIDALAGGGKDAVPVLIALVKDTSAGPWDGARVRSRAAELLGRIGADAADAGPALLAALKDEDIHVRVIAAGAVPDVVPKASAGDAVGSLMPLLAEDGVVGAAAARAIAGFGPDGLPALQMLLTAAKAGGDETARWNAVRAVGKIGPAAKDAAPALIGLLKDEVGKVREHAAESLGQIGAAEAVPALTAALKDPVARVRRDAVRSLGQLGAAAQPALADVKALMGDEDADVKAAAGKAARAIEGAKE